MYGVEVALEWDPMVRLPHGKYGRIVVHVRFPRSVDVEPREYTVVETGPDASALWQTLTERLDALAYERGACVIYGGSGNPNAYYRKYIFAKEAWKEIHRLVEAVRSGRCRRLATG